jgi:secretion/DNA translocation related TadE-like protein
MDEAYLVDEVMNVGQATGANGGVDGTVDTGEVVDVDQASKPDQSSERGSATVLILSVVTAAGLLIVALLAVSQVIVVRHRAGAIADLAALAAAGGWSEAGACARAERVARENSGRLVGCRVLGDGSVAVDAGLSDTSGLVGRIIGSARAGPAQLGPPGLGPPGLSTVGLGAARAGPASQDRLPFGRPDAP